MPGRILTVLARCGWRWSLDGHGLDGGLSPVQASTDLLTQCLCLVVGIACVGVDKAMVDGLEDKSWEDACVATKRV